MTKLTIIIVSYNTREELTACLHSLHRPLAAASHEVVVVDNGSIDGSPDAVRSGWPNARLIETGENIGYARANNRAIRATASELILLLNSDTVVPPSAIDALVRELDRHPRVAIVGPRLVDADGRPELSVGSMIGPLNEARQKLKGFALDRKLPLLSRWVGRTLSRRHQPDWVSGACLLIRRAAADKAGLLERTLLSLWRGRRPLRRRAAIGRTGAVRAGDRGGPPPGPFRPHRTGSAARSVPPQSVGVLREAPSGVGASPASVPPRQRPTARRATSVRVSPTGGLPRHV